MATRRKNTFTTFLSSIIDDSKDLVDDLIDRAKDVETDTRNAVRNAVEEDDDNPAPTNDEVSQLKKALTELTSKVEQLAEVKGAK